MNDERAGQEANGDHSGFDGAIEAFRQALVQYVKGDPRRALELFSQATMSPSRTRLALRAADRRNVSMVASRGSDPPQGWLSASLRGDLSV